LPQLYNSSFATPQSPKPLALQAVCS